MQTLKSDKILIKKVNVSAYKIPTKTPEADGTISWDSTTIVLVEVYAGNLCGLGYTYADASIVKLIQTVLAKEIIGCDALSISSIWLKMVKAVRNIGHPGMASMAIAGVDNALWDLKARILNLPLVTLLDAAHTCVPIYGSGGFTTYTIHQLQAQLSHWANEGITRVKMKIGQHPQDDLDRVKAAREAIGPDVELFVDANGAYSRKQALHFAQLFTQWKVTWFEEPVPATDLTGLRLLRDHAPPSMEIAAGEYGDEIFYFKDMIQSGGIDVLQADATRCNGITGFLQVAALCQAHQIELSTHTAPQLHAHVACAVIPLRHLEYFYDHVRIEQLLFDGVLTPKNGMLTPDLSRIGHGLEFKRSDASQYLVT